MNSRATERPELPLLRQMVGSPTVRETLTNAVYAARQIVARESALGSGNTVDSGSGVGSRNEVDSAIAPESDHASPDGPHSAAHQSAHMTHAWLFTGPPGAGRSVAAQAFAASLMCKEETPGCGQCEACRTALAGTHTDIVTIVPEGVVIPVKQVRDMIEAASRMPTTAQWRVVIVEDADRLNDAGANALLKSIEEPRHGRYLSCVHRLPTLMMFTSQFVRDAGTSTSLPPR